jgi:hypothetical protein
MEIALLAERLGMPCEFDRKPAENSLSVNLAGVPFDIEPAQISRPRIGKKVLLDGYVLTTAWPTLGDRDTPPGEEVVELGSSPSPDGLVKPMFEAAQKCQLNAAHEALCLEMNMRDDKEASMQFARERAKAMKSPGASFSS